MVDLDFPPLVVFVSDLNSLDCVRGIPVGSVRGSARATPMGFVRATPMSLGFIETTPVGL